MAHGRETGSNAASNRSAWPMSPFIFKVTALVAFLGIIIIFSRQQVENNTMLSEKTLSGAVPNHDAEAIKAYGAKKTQFSLSITNLESG